MSKHCTMFDQIYFTEPNRKGYRGYKRLYKGGGESTSTTKADPWVKQQPYLEGIFSEAQRLYNAETPRMYNRSMTARQTADTKKGQALYRSAAGDIQQTNDAAHEAAQFNLGEGRDVANNPYLQSAISAAINPAQRALTDVGGSLSNIRSTSMAAGQYGGSRQGLGEGIATSRFAQQALDTGASMSNTAYQNAQQQATATLGLVPGLASASQVPGQMYSNVGAQNESYNQALIDEQVQRWNFNQNRNKQELADYMSIIQGSYGGSSTATSSGGSKASPLLGAAGGAMAGAQLGSMVMPGIGTAIGAIGGALLGGLS